MFTVELDAALNQLSVARRDELAPVAATATGVDTYVRGLLQLESVEGVAVAVTDAGGIRTWLEAEEQFGGPTPLTLQHLKRVTGVSLLEDAIGYLLAVADADGNLTDLCVRDTDGQVPDWVLVRWAARLSAMGVGGDTYPKTAHNNISQMRKTRMKFAQLRAGDANTQLNIGFIGDSYTAGQAYYLRELCKSLAKDYGFAGPGYMGFNHGPALGDSNFMYNDSNAAYYGGSWTKSALGVASPDNRTIKAGAVGDFVGIQAVEAPGISTLITAAKLLYLGDGTSPVIRYRWADADAWNTLTLTGTGAQAVVFPVLPAGINWKFRLEVVSGLPTLFGMFASNAANGVTCSKLAASGSATGDWYKPADAAWMVQWKAAMALVPVDTYMIMLGGNDQGAGVAPATVLANLQGIIAALREINPSADFHVTIRQDTSRVSTYPMSAYAAPVRTWCWSQKIPCSDMQYAFGTDPAVYAHTGALPLIDTDLTHPISTTGGRLITEFKYRILRAAQ
ncbi:SGNH/GDSL hydrolase family protein [Pseudomonas sp. UMAB-40]|uniref:SGNH/GDSL hydrolase family protein n=1 Tax=Pseudomonas sp. UMAB-40 TaxID=1365407 RepID=UPI00214CC535|nr:SGNH/GDSL hydrolase family protein [Pseudomonas sp. UMAB-40]